MWRSRTLAAQILVAVLTILVITVSLGALLFARYMGRTLDHQYEQRALGVADAVAQIPEIRSAVAAHDPGSVIQGLAAEVQHSTGASYVVVIDETGIRYSHPNPALIGRRIEEPVVALDGRTHVGIDHGSLGRSANGKAPIRTSSGTVIGEVSVGILEREVSSQLRRELPAIALYSALALGLGLVASWLLARRLKRVTFGLEPSEIAALLQEREAMLHGIREGVIGFDAKGRLNVVNDEARRLLRIPTAVPGQHLDELIPPGRLRDLLSGEVRGSDQFALTDDYLLVVNRMPVTLRGRSAGSVVTLRDRTELESLIRELDTVNGLTAALRAQEHEFSNRLHVLTGLLDLGESGEAAHYLEEISTQSIVQAEELRSKISPPAVAALLIAKITVGAERGVKLEVTGDSRLDQPTSSTQILLTIIGNLVDNAFDAFDSPDVEGSDNARQVTIDLSDSDGEVAITVTDTGPGIAAEVTEQIFQDGYTTKSARGQMRRGLGLALVHRLVLRAGGSVSVTPGPGARFVVRFPAPVNTIARSTHGISAAESGRR
ncbi:MAG: two-component system, CitB family, sensor kinase [Actinomycetota bacterium]|nr:two-component system, CitB family, sensor kinase [Actinomycetota bacterium]